MIGDKSIANEFADVTPVVTEAHFIGLEDEETQESNPIATTPAEQAEEEWLILMRRSAAAFASSLFPTPKLTQNRSQSPPARKLLPNDPTESVAAVTGTTLFLCKNRLKAKDNTMATETPVKIDAKLVKELREKSGAPMGDCLKALQEAQGDMENAFVVLRKRGMASAAKKASRSTNEGAVGTYIHAGGKIGVMLELNCESDFVARTDDFQELLRDIAMHIAAVDPRFIGRDEVTEADVEREKEIYRAQAAATGKPANIIEKMLEGKMGKFYEESLPARPALHQGAVTDRCASHRNQGREAWRKHHRPPLRPLQDRRSKRDRRPGKGSRNGRSRFLTSLQNSEIGPGGSRAFSRCRNLATRLESRLQ